MEYRDFGRTGWRVSAISFGGWQLGGQWGDVDDEVSIRSLLHAYGSGVNFVDTAEYYGGATVRRSSVSHFVAGTATRSMSQRSPVRRSGRALMRTIRSCRVATPSGTCARTSSSPCVDWASSASTFSSCMADSSTACATSTGWRLSTRYASRARSTRLACRSATTGRTRALISLGSASWTRSRSCSTSSSSDRRATSSPPARGRIRPLSAGCPSTRDR